MKTTKTGLGELERAVMKIVWANPTVSAETVRDKLGQGHKETTVRTVLRRLEEKGLVRHEVDNRTFMYSAVEPRARVAARAVKRIVDWFCDGSVDEVLVGMVDSDMLDKAQLDRLMERVEQARQGKTGAGRAKKGAKR
ncbi:MAG TPA: BlaI/MecI/CopY family transcriptional regulator [Povalibacter sp.]|uniref:BlaI/MecI/CopY family transcriptional regulator n=1 Tax=Povalibacter sp. TaxID=1962978 RepID=UPI002C8CCFF0|nr:BlaI/MecI/CopY family transcriptional regulator [Povalibacter sp.]HMN45109.1 BlaI/MecI/CopY family transcriptional regulator [Povalibacter sp.]